MNNDDIQQRAERLIARQLRKTGFKYEPETEAEQFVQQVLATYAESGEQRQLSDRAFRLASDEMNQLNQQLDEKNKQLTSALRSVLRSEKIEKLNAELNLKNQALSRLANTDSLTGLLNRYSFSHSLSTLAQSMSTDSLLAVAIIDLDRFKAVNDTYGHSVGDELLIKISDKLEKMSLEGDLVARLGGDEFAYGRIVGSALEADQFAQALSSTLKEPITIANQQVNGGGSVGLVTSTERSIDPLKLIQDADIAMYYAKENVSQSYQVFDCQFHQEVMRRHTLEREVREAVEQGDFRISYQPIVSAESGKTVLLEALSRWDSPTLGTVAPLEFIPVIERLGLSVEFGRTTLTNACRQLAEWRQVYPDISNVAVAVNFAYPQLLGSDLAEFTATKLSEFQLKGHNLVLELTESELLHDFDRAVGILKSLRKLGIRIAIDDFGTGYSALAYLSRLPLDFVKIDKAFVQSMQGNSTDRLLTEVIIDLAHRFNLCTIGEGVELEAQSDILNGFGCDLLQGYYYSRPVEASALPAACGWSDGSETQFLKAA